MRILRFTVGGGGLRFLLPLAAVSRLVCGHIAKACVEAVLQLLRVIHTQEDIIEPVLRLVAFGPPAPGLLKYALVGLLEVHMREVGYFQLLAD